MPMPAPAAGELLIKVSACGDGDTELDEIEGRTSAGANVLVINAGDGLGV